jgi:hypothetical protein
MKVLVLKAPTDELSAQQNSFEADSCEMSKSSLKPKFLCLMSKNLLDRNGVSQVIGKTNSVIGITRRSVDVEKCKFTKF